MKGEKKRHEEWEHKSDYPQTTAREENRGREG